MSYYHIDGVSGVFASSDSHVHEQTKSWRLLLASVLLILSIVITTATIKIFTSVEQAHIQMPSVASAQAPMSLPQSSAVLGEQNGTSELQQELETWASGKSSSWSFYVQSLDSGETLAEVNASKKFQMASIYKLFLLQPLAKKLPAEAWASSNITERSYLACVNAMLAVSDNQCAEAIASKLGWVSVHKQVQAAGYKNTILNSAEKFGSTTSDTALMLDRLWHGDGYDAKTKSIALDALSKRKGVEAVRRACPGCTVYNKTGDLGGYKHDAAIVEKNGEAYVVVIFSSGGTWAHATEAASIIANRL